MCILCEESAQRLLQRVILFVPKIVCICTFLCVYVHIVPGSFRIKAFPCVSNYYSVGGHTEARGDV